MLYNTTSGVYAARVVRVDHYGTSKSPTDMSTRVHKLIGVPYGEKPERFKQSVMRKYEPGVHRVEKANACYQSVSLSAYGFFSLNETPAMSEDCLSLNVYIPVATHRQAHDDDDVSNLNNINNKEKRKKRKTTNGKQLLAVVVHIHGGKLLNSYIPNPNYPRIWVNPTHYPFNFT